VLSENRADPEACHGGRPEDAEDYAERARALHEEGRHEEASQELARAVREMRGVLEMTGQALAEVVRAQMALGRVAEAAALLAEAERCLPFRSGREVSFVARAFVAAGEYDRAVDLVRTPQPSDQGVVALIDLVQELARAGEHDRGASILAEFAHLGSACTPAYVTLAVEHPDPVRAREFTALALHLGPWHDAVPAVLHCEPGTVDLVVEEGERLRTRFRQTRR
jgi:tetratricopeptide (TPR) repeat protein